MTCYLFNLSPVEWGVAKRNTKRRVFSRYFKKYTSPSFQEQLLEIIKVQLQFFMMEDLKLILRKMLKK
jgi:hypothetical protein